LNLLHHQKGFFFYSRFGQDHFLFPIFVCIVTMTLSRYIFFYLYKNHRRQCLPSISDWSFVGAK